MVQNTGPSISANNPDAQPQIQLSSQQPVQQQIQQQQVIQTMQPHPSTIPQVNNSQTTQLQQQQLVSQTIQIQSQLSNQTNISTLDENSLEAAPQTEIPPSPAINGVVIQQVSANHIQPIGQPVAQVNGHVNIQLESVNDDKQQGSNDAESPHLQVSPGSASANDDKSKKYPFGNANCMPFKRTNVPPPERATRLPVSRIKNIMKFDPDVNIITQEAAYLVAKCTEQFVEGFAKAAYESTQTNKRKTLQKKDIENAILSEERYTFLDGIEMGNGS